MLSQTLEIAEMNELTSFSITFAILLLGGVIGGLANYWVAGPLQLGERRRLGRELFIGVITAITVPSLLSLLSSTLVSSVRFSFLDAMRIFAVSVVFTMTVRQLFAGIYATAGMQKPEQPSLGLLEVEILRAVEYQRITAEQMPGLPADLRVSPRLLANRVSSLQARGLIDHRQDEGGVKHWAVTKAGWESLNETLRKATE